jgi:hypothetical protein
MKKIRRRLGNGYQWKRLKKSIEFFPPEAQRQWIAFADEHGPMAARNELTRLRFKPIQVVR